MPVQSPERQRLRRLMEERAEELGVTWTEVAAAGGSSVKTLHSVRTEEHAIQPATRRAIELGLQWARGSVQRIMDDGDPVPLAPDAAPPASGRRVPAMISDAPEEEIRPYRLIVDTERDNAMPPRNEQEARIWASSRLDENGRRALVAYARWVEDDAGRSSQEGTG